MPKATTLTAPLRGSITLRAANLTVEGSVTAPGGNLDFSVFNLSPFTLTKLQAAVIKPPTPQVRSDARRFRPRGGGVVERGGASSRTTAPEPSA
ncbi:MAG: hypothetical protein WDN28_21920 [Chthoniobacter sp.]